MSCFLYKRIYVTKTGLVNRQNLEIWREKSEANVNNANQRWKKYGLVDQVEWGVFAMQNTDTKLQ